MSPQDFTQRLTASLAEALDDAMIPEWRAAELADVPLGVLQRQLSGDSELTIDTLERVCRRVLGVPPHVLAEGVEVGA